MIDILLKYQATIFGNFNDIEPTTENISKLINMFNDKKLLPGTFKEISLQAMNNPVLRLRFSSPNNEWRINFATDRIDIEKNPIELKGENLGKIENFLNESNDIFFRLLSEYKKKAYRVALITSGLFKEMNNEKLETIYKKIFQPIEFYQNNLPYEWNSRSVSKYELEIEKVTELLNVITSLNRIQGQMELSDSILKFNRIEVAFDINTTQDNKEPRFDMNFINDFFYKVNNIRTKILQNIEDVCNV